MHPVSLRLHAGAVIDRDGSSGAGKATLVRLLAGLEAPDNGIISRHPSLARKGAIMPVFQNSTASFNQHWPIWRAARMAAAARLLANMGLGEVDLNARSNDASTGQCQRLAIALALAADPLILLLDEPTSALDSIARRHIADLLLGAVARGVGLVVSTYDQWLQDALGAQMVRINTADARFSA